MSDSLMNASPHDGIVTGSCVILEDSHIVYAGPIKGAPDTAGKLVLMSAADFDKFKAHVERGRH